MYNLFKFLHIAAAIVWIGSGVGFVTLTAIMVKAGDNAGAMSVGRHAETMGSRLFGPAAMSTLLFGIITVVVSDGAWQFSDAWIVIGFVGVALSIVLVTQRRPAGNAISAAVAEHGPTSAQVAAATGRVRLLNLIDMVILFAVVAAMVFKPGA